MALAARLGVVACVVAVVVGVGVVVVGIVGGVVVGVGIVVVGIVDGVVVGYVCADVVCGFGFICALFDGPIRVSV